MLTFEQWLAQNYPNIESGSETALLKFSEYDAYAATYWPPKPESTIMSYEEWLAEFQYTASESNWGYYRSYVTSRGGADPGSDDGDALLDDGTDTGVDGTDKDADQLLYDEYLATGGTFTFSEWQADGQPATAADEGTDPDPEV